MCLPQYRLIGVLGLAALGILTLTTSCASRDKSGTPALAPAAPVPSPVPVPSPNPQKYAEGEVLHHDLLNDLSQWHIETEQPGTITAKGGTLSIDVPKGCTVWFKVQLSGPVLIQYEARMIQATPPGADDRVSDLNCFWMAADTRAKSDADFFSVPARTGAFATYNQLLTYYVGQGGNTNTTTRFRRYVGDAANRPLLPEHDLSAAKYMLTPNAWQKIQLVACGKVIEYYRDGQRIFQYEDPAPYTKGYFGIRTIFNHMEVRNLAIRRLIPA